MHKKSSATKFHASSHKEKYIIYFAGWKEHISLYPYTADMAKHFKESADYKVSGKGTIQFPLDKPLPLLFIRKIVKFRLQKAQK